MASEALKNVITMLRSRPASKGATWEERRAGMEAMQAQLELPQDIVCEPVLADGVPSEWIHTGEPAHRTILYLHGGGYTLGSIATHRFLVQRIARAARARALVVDYRLAPEHPFPAAVEDAVTAYRWLRSQGIGYEETFVAGDSAGGGLSLATLLALRDEGEAQPAGAVLLSPWTDLTGSGESIHSKASQDPMVTSDGLRSMADAYAPNQTGNPLVSPCFADLSGLPPLLIQVGNAEILLDDSTRLAASARAVNVEVDMEVWDDMIHVFQAFPMLEESERAILNIGSWVRQRG